MQIPVTKAPDRIIDQNNVKISVRAQHLNGSIYYLLPTG